MNTTVLEDIGLSKNEITIFVRLLELGESRAGKIIAETRLQSSAVHNAINSLIAKGLVSFIKKNSIRHYKAAEPEIITGYIDTKKREYLKLLPELKIRQGVSEADGVEFFRGYRGIKTLVFELFRDAKKGDTYRFIAPEAEYYKASTERVYGAEKQLRKELGVKTKSLFHSSARKHTKQSKTSIKRYLGFPLPPNTLMLNSKVAIVSWDREPIGILIRSKEICDSYLKFFEHLWKIAKD